jgi:micrococcal nuclease
MPLGDDRGTVFWFRVQLFVTLAQMDEVIQGTFEIRVIILTTAAGRSVIRANCRSGVQGEGMKRGQFGFCLIIFLLVLWAVPAIGWEGKVVRVLDGDSLRVRQGGRIVTLRLYGIDCPEYGQNFWRESKDAAEDMLRGKKVTVEPMDTDRYGRIVALVGSEGRLVNRELVRRGMAWVYPRFCTAQPLCRDFKKLEQAARARKIGLWRDDRPVPPWIWKRGKK